MRHLVIVLPLVSWLLGCSTTPIATQQHAAPDHGDVNLLIEVSRKGEVIDVKVRDTNLPKAFQESAVARVKTWHLQPKLVNGEPVESWYLVPIHFQVDETNKTNLSDNSVQPTTSP